MIPQRGTRSRPANRSRDRQISSSSSARESPRSISVPSGILQRPCSIGDLDILLHRAAENANLAPKLVRDVEDDLQPMHRRRECRDEQPSLRLLRISLQTPESPPVPMACVPERSRSSNRTAKRSTPSSPIRRSVFEIVWLADHGRVVDLVIAGVDDRPDRRVYRQRKTIDQRMRRVDELDLENCRSRSTSLASTRCSSTSSSIRIPRAASRQARA